MFSLSKWKYFLASVWLFQCLTSLLHHCSSSPRPPAALLAAGNLLISDFFWKIQQVSLFTRCFGAAARLRPRTSAASKNHFQSVDNLNATPTATSMTAKTITPPHSWECGICLNAPAESAGCFFPLPPQSSCCQCKSFNSLSTFTAVFPHLAWSAARNWTQDAAFRPAGTMHGVSAQGCFPQCKDTQSQPFKLQTWSVFCHTLKICFSGWELFMKRTINQRTQRTGTCSFTFDLRMYKLIDHHLTIN